MVTGDSMVRRRRTRKYVVHQLQVAQVREALEELLGQEGLGEDYTLMITKMLTNWGRIADFMDYALLNHGFKILTIMFYRGGKAVFVRFMRDLHGEWSFEGVTLGKRVNWGYRWEFDLEKMEGHEIRKKVIVRTPGT